MVDIRTLEKRVATLEQSAAAQEAAATGVDYRELRYEELKALCYGFVPVQEGERVRAIMRGELHVTYPCLPYLKPCIEQLSNEDLQRVAYGDNSPLQNTSARMPADQLPILEDLVQQNAIERDTLLASSRYVELSGTHDFALMATARRLHRDRQYGG